MEGKTRMIIVYTGVGEPMRGTEPVGKAIIDKTPEYQDVLKSTRIKVKE
jgi:hypothetical protein